MKTTETSVIPAELKAELQEAIENAVKGTRDPEKARAACAEMDRLREENRRLFGERTIAVELIRQTRQQG
jgi:hypothetical protein